MKKALVAVIFVVVAAIVALPSLLPVDKVKAQLTEQVKAATGRDLLINGKVSMSVIPSLSVQVVNVALSNPAGFRAKELVRLGELDVKLKLLPLLSGNLEIDSFVLVDPVISLEVTRDGRADWVFDSGVAAPAKVQDGTVKPADVKAGGGSLSDIHLGDVRIVNGKLAYIDDKANSSETVDALDLRVSLTSLDQPLSMKGGLKWRGQAVSLGVDLGKPRVLVDGRGMTPVSVTIGTDPVKVSVAGDVNGADKTLVGVVDLSAPSVRGLVAWATAKPLDAPGSGLGPLSLKGKLTAGGGRVAFTQAALSLDAIKAAGDFSVDVTGAKSKIKATLDVETLDVNPYLPPDSQDKVNEGSKAASDGKPAPAGKKQDWSDDPIDASALKAVEADMTLSVGAIKLRRIQLGKTRLQVSLHDGKLAADLSELALYKGTGKGRVALDGTQSGVGLDAAFSLKGVAAEPFLTDAAGFDRIEGTGNFDVQIAGRGGSQRQIVSSLAGKGAITFLDGAIKGINVANMLRNVGSAFTDTGGTQKTDFAELSGTFTIASGIVSNQDLTLKAPVLRVGGAGAVDLPKRTVNYRITPKVAATIEGQGGKQDASGLTVPVIVEGPWDNMSFRPDVAAMVKGNAGQAVKNLLGGVIPGQQTGKSGSLPINPSGLFGR